MNKIHKKEAKFPCDECTSKFTRRANLNDHIRISHSPESIRLQCNICFFGFRRQSDLNRHKRLQHDATPQFICGELLEHNRRGCGRPFKRPDALRAHRKSHNGRCAHLVWPQKGISTANTMTGGVHDSGASSRQHHTAEMKDREDHYAPPTIEDAMVQLQMKQQELEKLELSYRELESKNSSLNAENRLLDLRVNQLSKLKLKKVVSYQKQYRQHQYDMTLMPFSSIPGEQSATVSRLPTWTVPEQSSNSGGTPNHNFNSELDNIGTTTDQLYRPSSLRLSARYQDLPENTSWPQSPQPYCI